MSVLHTAVPTGTIDIIQSHPLSKGQKQRKASHMMSEHLDIKIFADILIELKRVSDANSRSVSTSIFDVNGSRYTNLNTAWIRIICYFPPPNVSTSGQFV